MEAVMSGGGRREGAGQVVAAVAAGPIAGGGGLLVGHAVEAGVEAVAGQELGSQGCSWRRVPRARPDC